MVKFLKTAPFSLVTLNIASDNQKRPTIDLGIHNTSHGMDHPRPAYHQTYSGPSRQVTIGLGSIACTLLITKGNKANSAANASFGNFDRQTRQHKDDIFPVRGRAGQVRVRVPRGCKSAYPTVVDVLRLGDRRP